MESRFSLSESELMARVHRALHEQDGWLPFDRFMALALYEPGLGYYSGPHLPFGLWPGPEGAGSDFVTAPELSARFGHTLARQVAQALQATGVDEVWEFGAGSGALACQVLDALDALGAAPRRYTLLEVSGSLRERQRQTLAAHAARVVWADRWPESLEAVLLGNEVLDAMPVKLLHRLQGDWHERGVTLGPQGALTWADRRTSLRPPLGIAGRHDYLTEIHPQAEAFMRSLGSIWRRGAGFFIDYGFPEAEYYHPQRHMGTLRCHRAHRSDDDPLTEVGRKDITAHVNFTGLALAAQDAGLSVLGYTSQGRFLINAGLLEPVPGLGPAPGSAAARRDDALWPRLVLEHEMGELFKVLALAPEANACGWTPLGLTQGDRSHRL